VAEYFLDDYSLLDYIEEEARLNLVKQIIDSACAQIITGCISAGERGRIRSKIKQMVMTFIPGKDDEYKLIYDSRLKRLLEQYPPD
jgi:hypothetical protein